MERSEPTLVPQWLRSAGSVTGGGNSAHHFASSSSHSDVSSLAPSSRNRTSKSTNDFETPRSAFLDRSSSSNSRRSSTNGSAKHAYSSFNRSHRDKDRDKDRDRDRDRFGDHWDRDSSEHLGNLFPIRVEKDTLRRSQSMVSRKQGELVSRRATVDLKNSSNSNQNNGNGLLSGSIGTSIQKAVFEKDFPSLGAEERQVGPEIGRVPSPGFTTAVQSLPVGSSALVGGEGWTSALVEVPPIMGSSSSGALSAQQTVAATSGSTTPTAMAGLNMAEALAQAPSRARTTPQLSVKTQRLEELAIKQSRQLIPVTPSMPKASVLSSEKSKPKIAARSGEMNVATKAGQQQLSSLQNVNQYLRSGNTKFDAPKTSHGKFLVLKPGWENGVTPSSKEVTSPTNGSTSRAANTQLTVAPPVVSAPSKSPNGQKASSVERKVSALDLKLGSTLEKRPSLSQVQSRNDFFNRLKGRNPVNPSTVLPESGPNISSPTSEKSGEGNREAYSAPASPHPVENGTEVNGNGENCKEIQSFSDVGEDECPPSSDVCPDEEEAKFLRSLGWDENAGEDDGLTEEEINAFYEEWKKTKPLLKVCRGLQPKLLMLSESHATNPVGAELSSSDSGSDA